jgi:carboxyl-terminal processing protease
MNVQILFLHSWLFILTNHCYLMMKNIFALLLTLPLFCVAQQGKQEPFQQKAMLVKRFMEKNHYQPLQWNDSASSMLFDKWIKELDGEKLFFTQKDIATLAIYKNNLDEEMQGKSWNFFNASTTLYKKRIQKADSLIQSFLAKPIDFTKPDNLTWPTTTFAASETELVKRWQQYLKWRLLDNIADDLTDDGKVLPTTLPTNFSKIELEERQKGQKHESNYIKNKLQTPELFLANMQDGYLNAITWCYDPHSTYMNLKEKEEFGALVSAMEYSAGLAVDENEKGDKTIGYLQPGGSAWKSGQLHKGDVLLKVKVNGLERDVADISEDELDDALSGNKSGDVEITFKTAAGVVKTTKLLLEKVSDEEEKVKSYVVKATKKIGYINLPGFYSREEDYENLNYNGCANDVSKEIIKLRKDNIEGLILDLRNNGGGSMWEAMQLAGIFIDIGPVASMKAKDGKVSILKDPNRGTIYDGPLMVLINGQSASASEFLSATLQDYNRAIIVGGTTYGKGTAQVVVPLDTNKVDPNKKYEDFVKVTQDKFYRVNGSTVQWKGVEPDIALPDFFEDISFKEKANVSALKPDNSKVGNYTAASALPIASLKIKSDARVSIDPFFKTKQLVSKFISQSKNGISIPLQWTSFSQYYSKAKERFALFADENKALKTEIIADNNIFDKDRFKASGTQVKETNETYLKQIAADKVIVEACKIFEDMLIK